jgi:hypothetical protein
MANFSDKSDEISGSIKAAEWLWTLEGGIVPLS